MESSIPITDGNNSLLLEKVLITASLFAAFPLFHLDKHLLGHRRFAWIGAFCTGLTVHWFLDPAGATSSSSSSSSYNTDDEKAAGDGELTDTLDKFTLAFVSIGLVPHIMKLIKDNPFIGLGSIPPFFVVTYLMLQTAVGSDEYWKLRAYLHMAVFVLPYLNHLPGSSTATTTTTTVPSPDNEGDDADDANDVGTETDNTQPSATATTTTSSKSSSNKSTKGMTKKSKTNKKKR